MYELRNITKTFVQNKTKVSALDNVNLKIEKGEFVAIMGVSGSGKTTLLNILGCLLSPTLGEMFLNGKNITTLTCNEASMLRQCHIGFVLQDMKLLASDTVEQNVSLPLLLSKAVAYKHIKKICEEVLKKLNILNLAKIEVSKLSGGQKQRVAIARALVANPEIILADEPTSALDHKTAIEIMEVFSTLHKEGKTIVLVTHDEKIAAYAKGIIRLEDGRIL